MKGFSVKLKLSIWVSLLFLVLGVVFTMLLVAISSRVSKKQSVDTLIVAVTDNLKFITGNSGDIPLLSRDFVYSHGGIDTVVYNSGKSLLAGQIPSGFTGTVDFVDGEVRLVSMDSEDFLILDIYYPFDWETGVWLRGIMKAPDNEGLVNSLMAASMILLPVFIIFSFGGSILLARASFRPLDAIIRTTESIREGDDLSGRLQTSDRNDEFDRLSMTINGMFGRLEDSFEAKKQFTSDASHELRTPISVIKTACECSESYDETPEEFRASVAMIHRQADHMNHLVNDLLELARLDGEFAEKSFALVDLNEIAALCCEEHSGSGMPADEKGISIENMTNNDQTLAVNGDSVLLMRVISNLILNGIKYGREGGHVWVGTRLEDREVCVYVKDDGQGIPDDKKEKIWERFYQADSSRGVSEGVGLGLAFVERIVKLHGGRVSVDSTPGQGSTFLVYIPAL